MDKHELLALAVGNPDMFFKNFAKYGAHKDIKEVMLAFAEASPNAVLQYADFYKKKPYAEAVISGALSRETSDGLLYADLFAKEPYAGRVISEFSKAELFQGLWYAKHYASEPYAGDIIAAAAKIQPELALEYAHGYAKQPYAEPIIRDLAKAHPKEALAYSSHYADAPYGKSLLLELVSTHPKLALDFLGASPYSKHTPYGASRKLVVEKEQQFVMEHLGDALPGLAEKYPRLVLSLGEKLAGQPYADAVLRIAGAKDPEAAAMFATHFSTLPYGTELISKTKEQAAQKAAQEALGAEVSTVILSHYYQTKRGSKTLFRHIGNGDQNVSTEELKKTLADYKITREALDKNANGTLEYKEIYDTLTSLPKGSSKPQKER